MDVCYYELTPHDFGSFHWRYASPLGFTPVREIFSARPPPDFDDKPVAIVYGGRLWRVDMLGVEPRFALCDSVVLPLNYTPIGAPDQI